MINPKPNKEMKAEELKAHDLMIGNLVTQNGFYGYVYSIESPMPLKDKRFSDKFIITLFDNGLISIPINEVQPIPLTEEWLVRFGFEKQDNGWYKLIICEDYINLYWEKLAMAELSINGLGMKLPHIKYVHTLQNLIYTLTNEHLTIKEK